MRKVILSHPTGNANVRSAVGALLKFGLLGRFYTSVACFSSSFFYRITKWPLFREFRRRAYNDLLKPYTVTYPLMELGRMLCAKFGLKSLVKHETGLFSVHSVYCNQDKIVAKQILKDNNKLIGAVYAYEDGALESFKAAQSVGCLTFYELPIPYWRCFHKILEHEKLQNSEWAKTLTGLKDSEEKLKRKDAELEIADVIFVANSFTKSSLEYYPDKLKAKIEVIPYGFPPVVAGRSYNFENRRKIKLLFVGSLSQQKGLANLFNAIENLSDNIELTIVGKKVSDDCQPLNRALEKYKWIPSLPHSEVLKIMHMSDVLLFPSLFEGFGMVITEAMSQGTPVITTRNTAGIDLIKHGENGWLIEAGSTLELKLCIENLIKHPELIVNAGRAAMETARQRPWEVYEEELSEAVRKYLD